MLLFYFVRSNGNQIAIPVNAAFQHPYYSGTGAAAIYRMGGEYDYRDSHDIGALIEDLKALAILEHNEHPAHNRDYHFSVTRVYSRVDIRKVRPQLEQLAARLNKAGYKKVNLDDALKDPPQLHSKQ